MRAPEAPLWAGPPPMASANPVWEAAELSYAARGLQTQVAQLLARVDAVPDPALQRLAASVRERSDLVSSSRRLLQDDLPAVHHPPAVFDLAETLQLALDSWNDTRAGVRSISARVPSGPVRVMGQARSLHRALTRARAIVASGGDGPVGVTAELSTSRAGARLDLVVPGVELPAVALTELVEGFFRSCSRPIAAPGVNVHMVAGRVQVATGPVTARTSPDETSVSALWELEASLDDAA